LLGTTNCSTITYVIGGNLVSELRRVFLVKSRSTKVCQDYAKRSFCRAANAIFGKIGRLASEEVTLQTIVSANVAVWSGDLHS